ncbi:MAG: AraC family transcriptional regulator [Pseudomonadota bacterium]
MKTTRFHKTAYLGPDEAFHFARKQLAKRFPEHAHDHDFYEVFLIEKGRTSHWVNGVTQTLEAGQLVFMRPSDFHAFCADRKSGCQIINVIFRAETVAHLRDRYAETIAGRFFDYGGPLPELHTLGPARFSRAVTVAEQLQTAARTLAHIEEFLLVLINRVAHVTSSGTSTVPRWFAQACSAALSPEVFRQGSAGFISASGRSHEHVCRVCRAQTGYSPSEYINRIRIDHAAMLLRSSEMTISEISESCGFQNSSYFHRLFRAQISQTPKAYRRKFLGDPF